MKKVIIIIVAVLMVIAALGLFTYPFISNYVNSKKTDSAVMQYLDLSSNLNEEDYEDKLHRANEYNNSLVGSVSISDPFAEDDTEYEYEDLLILDNSGVIATIKIPAIDVNLPIYAGTGSKTLEKGIGHMATSSLPVGGLSTHCVLTGHTGFGGLKLFTDLDNLDYGDVFYVNCLGETMAYQVDNIAKVLPEETDLLEIEPDKDYVTLVTCTPYGINTHRLLVRGKRIPIEEAEKQEITQESTPVSKWENEYQKAIVCGIAVMLSILALFAFIKLILFIVRKRKKNEEKSN